MTQTRLQSLAEALANIAVGFGIGLVSQYLVFPLAGLEQDISFGTHFEIAMYFTVISLTRSYIIRRWFNGQLIRIERHDS